MDQLLCTCLSWCQPSISLYFPNIPLSTPSKIWGFSFVPTYSLCQAQSVLSSSNQHTNQPFYHPLSLCYISFPHSQSPSSIIFFSTCTFAESRRCDGVGMLIHVSGGTSSNSSFPHRSFWLLVPLQHCSSTMGRLVCLTLSRTHYCGFSCISGEAC